MVQQLSTKSFLGTNPKCAVSTGPRVLPTGPHKGCPVQGCAAAPRGPAPASLGEGLGAQPREQSRGMLLDFFRKPAADNPVYFVNASEWFLQSLVLGSAGLEHRARSRSSSNTLGQQRMLREPVEGCFLSQSILTHISCFQTCQSSKQSGFGE